MTSSAVATLRHKANWQIQSVPQATLRGETALHLNSNYSNPESLVTATADRTHQGQEEIACRACALKG